jgi:hypothetical protein
VQGLGDPRRLRLPAHGGATRAAREKAARRSAIADLYRMLDALSERHRRDVERWRIGQILTTAELLGIGIEDVTRQHIWLCHAWHGRPPLGDPPWRKEPDRRFRANRRLPV